MSLPGINITAGQKQELFLDVDADFHSLTAKSAVADRHRQRSDLHEQSIPAAPIPPGQLRGICTNCQSRGSDISQPQGYPRAFDTTWFLTRDPNVGDFVGKDQ